MEERKFSIYAVDSYDNGISFGRHDAVTEEELRMRYALSLDQWNQEILKPRMRHSAKFAPDTRYAELERQLMRLSQQGELRRSIILLGATSDPFFPFDGKFDASMKFLELFSRYKPGLLIVQTRSPLIVIGLPILSKLGKALSLTIPIETNDDLVVQRYSPGIPSVRERFKCARALSRFGIEVTAQVSPILPYGDWKGDALKFAVELSDVAKYVRIYNQRLSQSKRSSIAKQLAEERRFHLLREDAHQPLLAAIARVAPEKLRGYSREHLEEKQSSLFAA
jgi:DNA repair photolyase